jgi:DNA-binding response OmpR family regulator
MSGLAREAGFAGAYCQTSCEECAYYQEVVGRHRRVLIVTDSGDLPDRLLEESASSSIELRFARSEYECSALCAEFRPEYVVVDAALPKRARASLCAHLAADPRIPGVQIILAVRREGAEQVLIAAGERALPRTFSLAELENHIIGLEVTPEMTA